MTTAVAFVVLLYVLIRLANPTWSLAWRSATRLFIPMGTLGGVLQGAIGISAPISVTIMHSVDLKRRQFIVTISVFFCAMALIQFPAQVALGVMTWERAGYSVLAIAPLLVGMPIGEALVRRFSKTAFDRIILAVLTVQAIRLLIEHL